VRRAAPLGILFGIRCCSGGRIKLTLTETLETDRGERERVKDRRVQSAGCPPASSGIAMHGVCVRRKRDSEEIKRPRGGDRGLSVYTYTHPVPAGIPSISVATLLPDIGCEMEKREETQRGSRGLRDGEGRVGVCANARMFMRGE
jgi:hypothetical protein